MTSLEPVYRRNFVLFLLDGVLFVVALGFINSTTVIPDFMRQLTDSEILIGLSSSLFGVGYTLPQLFVARYLMGVERKKWWFIIPNIPTRFVILLFGIILWFMGANHYHLILVLFLGCYTIAALGDGLVGVPWADLAGSSLDERWRARMFGSVSGISGLIMLGVTPLIGFILGTGGPEFPNNYALLFALSGILFVVSIFPVVFVRELPNNKPVEPVLSLQDYLPKLLHVLQEDKSYRAIVIAQTFTTLYLMAMPFYIGFSTEVVGLSSAIAVPTLLAMQTIGNILGALLYTWLGAKDNLLFLRMALIGAATLPLLALLVTLSGMTALLYIGFLGSGMAITNIMFAYQNWIVTYAPENVRPMYVGLSNTINAVVAFIAPIIGGVILQNGSYGYLFFSALVMALIAFAQLVFNLKNPKKTMLL